MPQERERVTQELYMTFDRVSQQNKTNPRPNALPVLLLAFQFWPPSEQQCNVRSLRVSYSELVMDQKPRTPAGGADTENCTEVDQKIEMKLTQLHRLMHHFASQSTSNLYPDLPYQVDHLLLHRRAVISQRRHFSPLSSLGKASKRSMDANILVKNDGEIEMILKETAGKIKSFKEATTAKRVETSNREALEALSKQHEAIQKACLNEFQNFKLKADERERELLLAAKERDKQFEVFRKKLERDVEDRERKLGDRAKDREEELLKASKEREQKIQEAADRQIESLRREMDDIKRLLAEKSEKLKQATDLAEQYVKDLGESKRLQRQETEPVSRHRLRCEPVDVRTKTLATPESKQKPQQEQEPEPKRASTPNPVRASTPQRPPTPQRAVTPKPPFIMKGLQSPSKDDRLLHSKAYQDSKLRINDEIKRMKWLMRDRDSVHGKHSSLEVRGY